MPFTHHVQNPPHFLFSLYPHILLLLGKIFHSWEQYICNCGSLSTLAASAVPEDLLTMEF
jgi:hypothetical protein